MGSLFYIRDEGVVWSGSRLQQSLRNCSAAQSTLTHFDSVSSERVMPRNPEEPVNSQKRIRNCRKRADAEGWQIVMTFADAAISGSDNSRPQYLAMLAAGASGEFDVLLLDDLSRLTRDSGGKPKFLLSGLLRCGRCDAHYIISNQRGYACSSFINGNACTNTVRVRRDAVEHAILDPVRKELLARDRAERMAAELQALYVDHVQRIAARGSCRSGAARVAGSCFTHRTLA